MRRWNLAGIALLGLGLAACGRPGGMSNKGGDKNAEQAAVPVEVVPVKRGEIIASYSGTATLEADREAQVVAKTSGVLLKLMAEEGDHVRQGQILAKIDPESTRLQLAQTESTLRRLENDYRRANDMFGSKLISQESFDKIRYDLETQKAAYDLAKLELSYTDIVAPIDGVISSRLVKEGNLIQLHQALFKIDDFDPLLGVLNVPERDLATIRPGLAVSMTVDALFGKTFDGKVARVSPVVDPKTGTFRVTCEFSDKTGLIKSGMFGRIDVVFDHRENVLVLPRAAVIDEDGQTSVFVATKSAAPPPAPGKDGKPAEEAKPGADGQPAAPPKERWVASRRNVKLGYTSGDSIELVDGLAEGDQIITVGRAALRDGSLIDVILPDAGKTAAAATTKGN